MEIELEKIVSKIEEVLSACDAMYDEIERTTKKCIVYEAKSNQFFQARFNELFEICKLKGTKYQTLMQPYWLKPDKVLNLGNIWIGDRFVKQSGGYLIKEEIDIIVGIIKEIKAIYCGEKEIQAKGVTSKMQPTQSSPIIFLCHSSSDKQYGDILRDLIVGLGVKNDQLIYTSHIAHKIPLDNNIFDYLYKQMSKDIFVVFLLSEEFFNRPISLNEMGAAWIRRRDYSSVFVPRFDINNTKFKNCVIDPNKIGINLGGTQCKANALEFANKIIKLFKLKVDNGMLMYLLDEFMDKIKNVSIPAVSTSNPAPKIDINPISQVLLQFAKKSAAVTKGDTDKTYPAVKTEPNEQDGDDISEVREEIQDLSLSAKKVLAYMTTRRSSEKVGRTFCDNEVTAFNLWKKQKKINVNMYDALYNEGMFELIEMGIVETTGWNGELAYVNGSYGISPNEIDYLFSEIASEKGAKHG